MSASATRAPRVAPGGDRRARAPRARAVAARAPAPRASPSGAPVRHRAIDRARVAFAVAPPPSRRRAERLAQTRAWGDNTAEGDVPVPIAVVWELWQDKTRIPRWMPWIHSIDVVDETRSRWNLRTNQFGQDFSFSWTATDFPPITREKIHWQSTEGLPNRGAVTFAGGVGGAATNVRIRISYEVPDVLAPFGGAVAPLVENILRADLARFSEFARKVGRAMARSGVGGDDDEA